MVRLSRTNSRGNIYSHKLLGHTVNYSRNTPARPAPSIFTGFMQYPSCNCNCNCNNSSSGFSWGAFLGGIATGVGLAALAKPLWKGIQWCWNKITGKSADTTSQGVTSNPQTQTPQQTTVTSTRTADPTAIKPTVAADADAAKAKEKEQNIKDLEAQYRNKGVTDIKANEDGTYSATYNGQTYTGNKDDLTKQLDDVINAKETAQAAAGSGSTPTDNASATQTATDGTAQTGDKYGVSSETTRRYIDRLKGSEGTWYTSHGYVNTDGTELTEAERKEVENLLKQETNMIAKVDLDGDGKFEQISLPSTLTLSNNKTVKLLDPDKAKEVIMALGGKAVKNGVDTRYTTQTSNTTWFVVDKDKHRVDSKNYDTKVKAEEAAKAKNEEERNKTTK